MKSAIIGPRLFNNYIKSEKVLANYKLKDIECIITGGAEEADALVAEFVKRHQLQIIEYMPK